MAAPSTHGAAIPYALIKSLHDQHPSLPLKACKQALVESGGDLEAAAATLSVESETGGKEEPSSDVWEEVAAPFAPAAQESVPTEDRGRAMPALTKDDEPVVYFPAWAALLCACESYCKYSGWRYVPADFDMTNLPNTTDREMHAARVRAMPCVHAYAEWLNGAGAGDPVATDALAGEFRQCQRLVAGAACEPELTAPPSGVPHIGACGNCDGSAREF